MPCVVYGERTPLDRARKDRAQSMLQPEGASPDARIVKEGNGERRRAQARPQLQRYSPQLQVEEKRRQVARQRGRKDKLPV